MQKGLKKYFPQIRTRKEVLDEINRSPVCSWQFAQWNDEQKKEFLDVCTGVRGVKMTYDSFFKEIMNPDVHPERLEELLSLLLGQNIHIRQVLPNDSVRLADESSLLITDIVVELEEGSLANIEIQKIGYAFPGQRGACYSADLLLRQYKRVKGQRKKKFTYQDVKTVYTIVFFEKSTSEFHEIESAYIHRAKQVFQTGLNLNMLQEYVLIPLDIYKESTHNKTINNKLEAWLSFLCDDSPERILEIVGKYPVFQEMYEEVYEICGNIEGVMDMFSKELLELDRNTVQYMIEEQQEQLDALHKEVDEKRKEVEEQKKILEEQKRKYVEQQRKYVEQQKMFDEQQRKYEVQQKRLEEQQKMFDEQQRKYEDQQKRLEDQQKIFVEQQEKYEKQCQQIEIERLEKEGIKKELEELKNIVNKLSEGKL
ncbi:PD-(D/E)XK nuclease family transposase [Faecalicatena orotica]|uniref:PD-(D/E)XK nuclease family transposase n=1 Tax=Faecalicatena orotica TaxID=1544 RepID=UPI003216A53F